MLRTYIKQLRKKKKNNLRRKAVPQTLHKKASWLYMMKQLIISMCGVIVGFFGYMLLWNFVGTFPLVLSEYPLWFYILFHAVYVITPICGLYGLYNAGIKLPCLLYENNKQEHILASAVQEQNEHTQLITQQKFRVIQQDLHRTLFISVTALSFTLYMIDMLIIEVFTLYKYLTLNQMDFILFVYIFFIMGSIGLLYQFLYKPARAGRLPKWLYRWLERKNPRMALPSALTDAAATPVDNAEYTVVDDAPERADA